MPEELNNQPGTQPEGGAPNGEPATPPVEPAPNGQEPQGGQQEPGVNPVDGQEPKQGNPAEDDRVKKANAEAAKYRTERNELREAMEAAKAEQSDMVQKIGKVFGFVSDEDAEQADTTKLVEQITGERDTLQAELKTLRQENALNTALNGYKVDGKPVALDSSLTLAVVRGTGALNDLDPASDDYPAQVARVVSETVEAHPQLKTQVVPKSSGNAPTPTAGGDSPLTKEDLDRMMQAGEHEEINKAFAAGRFKFDN